MWSLCNEDRPVSHHRTFHTLNHHYNNQRRAANKPIMTVPRSSFYLLLLPTSRWEFDAQKNVPQDKKSVGGEFDKFLLSYEMTAAEI